MTADAPLSADAAGVVRQRSPNLKSRPAEKTTASRIGEKSDSTDHPKSQGIGRRGGRSTRAWIILSLVSFVVLVVAMLQRSRWTVQRGDFVLQASKQESLDLALNPAKHFNRPPTNIVHKWRVSQGYRSPDGVTKRVYLINDQFVGPTIEAQSGDTLTIEVFNDLEGEGLAVHWHGLRMRGFNEHDGAVGITQDPIPPHRNFTYHFQIANDQAGTFWYHAHNQEQRADGLFGALIVHSGQSKGVIDGQYGEERVLMINDWYHRSGETALNWYMRPNSMGMEPVPDSILINGIGYYDCSKAVPARPVECHQKDLKPRMQFEAGRTYRLRIVNSGMLAGFTLTTNGPLMTVLEVDGGTKVRKQTGPSAGMLYPGQRVDVLLRWNQPGEHLLKVSLDREGFRYPNPALVSEQIFPVVVVGNTLADSDAHPNSEDVVDLQQVVAPNTQAIAPNADMTIVLYTTTLKLARLKNIPHGFINHTTWKSQSPPLLDLPRSEYNSHQLVPSIPLKSPPLWVDIVLNNLDDDHHPFHLHGYSPYLVQSYASGARFGVWNPFEAMEGPGGPLNLHDPVARDTFIVPRKGYIVLRFRADNLGIWLFHCHVLWHLGSGMAMAFEVGAG